MNDVLVSIRNVVKRFHTGSTTLTILKGINLAIHTGEILAMTGASGVGKSTLLHIIGGLDQPCEGQVIFNGNAIHEWDDAALSEYRNQSIGFVFQFHHLLPEFTAIENVAIPILINRRPKEMALERARELLELVDLPDRMEHKPGQLSGGEQQRVALARALALKPRLILADEPTGNLDEGTAESMFDLIRIINKENQVAFLIATHNLRLARIADRWMILSDGRVEKKNIAKLGVATGNI